MEEDVSRALVDDSGDVLADTDAPIPDRVEGIQTPATIPEEDINPIVDPEGNETALEPGSGTPDLESELRAIDLESPCDLFSDSELSELMSAWSAAAGVFPELPFGLGDDTRLDFVMASSDEGACEWFSDGHLWYVGVSWEVADPTFIQVIGQRFDDQPEARAFEIGDVSVFITNDVTAELLAAGLHVTITNLVPSDELVSGDIDVTSALAEEIARRLA